MWVLKKKDSVVVAGHDHEDVSPLKRKASVVLRKCSKAPGALLDNTGGLGDLKLTFAIFFDISSTTVAQTTCFAAQTCPNEAPLIVRILKRFN